MKKLTLILLALLVAVPFASAQELADEELPEIPYVRARAGFNVPYLDEATWTSEITDDLAIFTDEELDARISVQSVMTLDDETALQTAISTLVDVELPSAPLYQDRIGLTNGTWTQVIYQVDDTTITALALVRRDRTYVVTFVEQSAAYDAYHLIVRQTDPESDDPTEGVQTAITRLLDDDFSADAVEQRTVTSLPSGDWQRSSYPDEITAYGLVFGSVTYSTLITGDDSNSTDIADAFNTIFLGFFITPNNDEFLYLGLGAIAFIFLGLVASIWWRFRSARQDLRVIEQIANDS